jgi:hypothetical protein
MHSRRCLNDRCHDNVSEDDGSAVYLITLLIRWLISLLVNGGDI